jgi:2,3-diaminopropionate biosynthesis protein SbnB
LNTNVKHVGEFSVIAGEHIYSAIFSNPQGILDIVRDAYLAHHRGETVNPDSYFLRFPHRPENRIIALPAHLAPRGGTEITGIKWISSFPKNIETGVPRASAVVILNDPETGYPVACLEGGTISAARTAASAVLAAQTLNHGMRSGSIGVVGCGVIARYIIDFFVATGWDISSLHVYDKVPAYARKFADHFDAKVDQSAEDTVGCSDISVFTTTSAAPYFNSSTALEHRPLVLHVSLRDLAPQIILSAHNVVDDIDHCLKANTSPHLAEQRAGNRDFVRYTLPAILAGAAAPDRSKPIIFSPFGMGILDLAVAQRIFEQVSAAGQGVQVANFFPTR